MISFKDLPPQILLRILNYLDLETLTQLRQCDKYSANNEYLLAKLQEIKSTIKAKKELEAIFHNQIARVISLKNWFASNNTHVPLLMNSELDHGRSNSHLSSLYASSFFQDIYHREGVEITNTFSLLDISCSINTQHASYKLICIDSLLLDLVLIYLSRKAKNPMSLLHSVTLNFWHLKYTETGFAIIVKQSHLSGVFHELGYLGALPSRDWQLSSYIARKNVSPHNFYFEVASLISHYPTPSSLLIDPVMPNISFHDIKLQLLSRLMFQKQGYSLGILEEQRLFYTHLLIKFLTSITIDSLLTELQGQALLALLRINDLVKDLDILEYANFLRRIHATLDEVLVLLHLRNKNNPLTALTVSQQLEDFITTALGGIRPQIATLRSSGMQAISSALQMCIKFFQNKGGDSITLHLSKRAYFELSIVLNLITDIETEFETNLNYDISLQNLSANVKRANKLTVFDLYLGNFESNVQMSERHLCFTNIVPWVEHQMGLRQKLGIINRPLLIILDNTISHFNAVYLPQFLFQFKKELATGEMAVLVAHSGNKYLHLGLDYCLASFLYFFGNCESFKGIVEGIQSEISKNKLGSFYAQDSTILLTQMFLQEAKPEILHYSHLIRLRTSYLFKKVIPSTLVAGNGYFTIDSGTYKTDVDKTETEDFKEAGGFITIKRNISYELAKKDLHVELFKELLKLLNLLGFNSRDGFGFSQSTSVVINTATYPSALRLSIGTESIPYLAKKINCLCNYLQMINAAMNKSIADVAFKKRPYTFFITYLDMDKIKDDTEQFVPGAMT